MAQILNSPHFSATMRDSMLRASFLSSADKRVNLIRLTENDRDEVLDFLSQRPIHTVALAGFIRDNGLVSAHNRGAFYGCRNSQGQLEGVALIGHATLIEARTERAMREFGRIAQAHTGTHMIMVQREEVAQFWTNYAREGREIRRACSELLFELRYSANVKEEIRALRPANLNDLDQIVPLQAEMAEEESGVNPLTVDAEGFRARCARRISLGRTWILEENGRLLFKADIQADTPHVVYLEGVWVAPTDRGRGIGRKCLTQLCRDLLARSESVCLFVNEECERAQSFYRRCNFRLRGVYDSLFMCKG